MWSCGQIGKGHLILQLSRFGCGLWTCGRISNSQTESLSFTLDVVLCLGMWASGLRADWKKTFNLQLSCFGVGCGLVGRSQIVRQKVSVLHWMWYSAKECGLLGLRAD
jgi:hypothetical protein